MAFVIGITIAWRKFGSKAEAPVFTGFASFAYHTFRINELYDLSPGSAVQGFRLGDRQFS